MLKTSNCRAQVVRVLCCMAGWGWIFICIMFYDIYHISSPHFSRAPTDLLLCALRKKPNKTTKTSSINNICIVICKWDVWRWAGFLQYLPNRDLGVLACWDWRSQSSTCDTVHWVYCKYLGTMLSFEDEESPWPRLIASATYVTTLLPFNRIFMQVSSIVL